MSPAPSKPIRLAVASGKGGTGKTTVATNLAHLAGLVGWDVAYLDCDVEEPNGALFLQPDFGEDQPVLAAVPEVDADACTGCGQCGKICQFSAIIAMGRTVLTFPELCHGCGGCWTVCPSGAIRQGTRPVGVLQSGQAGAVRFVQGVLNVGEAMSPPVIRAVKRAAPRTQLTVADCPPGTSCPAIEALRGNDYALLVTEPTPFGLHDLRLAVETVRQVGMPLGVVVNRAGDDDRVHRYCRDEGIAILAEIPDDRAVAEAYSRGQLACEATETCRRAFEGLLAKVVAEVEA